MSKSMRTRLALAAVLLAPLPAALAATSGSVNLKGSAWTVADGIALHDDDEIEVVLLAKAFDLAKAKDDGKLDSFDVMRQSDNHITINVDADGPTMCVDFSSRVGDTTSSGSSCNSDFPPTIKITTHTATQIAGSMDWSEDGGDHIKVQFDLPIQAAAE